MRDFSGKRFNSLVGIRRFDPPGSKRFRWVFRCDCGSLTRSDAYKVAAGQVRSCRRCAYEKQKIHGMAGTREFQRLAKAKQRCTNPRNARYRDYGGRGIRWEFESYAQALAILGCCPPGLTLDRIDNNGHYSPLNVRWATQAEQIASRRPWNWRQKNSQRGA